MGAFCRHRMGQGSRPGKKAKEPGGSNDRAPANSDIKRHVYDFARRQIDSFRRKLKDAVVLNITDIEIIRFGGVPLILNPESVRNDGLKGPGKSTERIDGKVKREVRLYMEGSLGRGDGASLNGTDSYHKRVGACACAGVARNIENNPNRPTFTWIQCYSGNRNGYPG